LLGDLRQVSQYMNDADIRRKILGEVLQHIQSDTRIVIGHSLGSVVAYEALCEKPEQVRTFLSLGSPLGMRNVVFDKLTPRPSALGVGRWPGNVAQWTNIAAKGDIVAAQKQLTPLFGEVKDKLIDSGWDAHSSTRYLNSIQAGKAVAESLGVL
jgi:pimeloyl-ACP methyl ester carboxylesterase